MAKAIQHTVTIDEALDETKYGKFNYFLICVSGFVLINVILESLGISFVLPITKCDMDLTYQEKGVLGAVGFMGIISSSNFWGFLADTTGRRRIICPTLIAGYLVSIVSSFSPNFATLVLLRYANGILISGGSATIYAYLGEFHCNKMRNRSIMAAAFVCAAASCAYPIMAWSVINQTWAFEVPLVGIVYRPWRMYILCCGILGFVAGLCFFYLPESPKYLLSVGREDEAIAVLKTIYAINTGQSVDSYIVTSLKLDIEDEQRFKVDGEKLSLRTLIRTIWNQTVPLFMQEHYRKTVLLCVIQFWIFFTAQGIYMWFPYLLDNVMQFTSQHPTERQQICEMFYFIEGITTATNKSEKDCDQTLESSTFQYTLALEFVYVAICLGVGYCTGKIGRIWTLFFVLVICGSCGIFCTLVNITIMAVYFLMVMLVCGLGTTVVNAIAVDIYPTHLRAMAVCISLMMGRIGSVIGTNVVGTLLEYHCQSAIILAGVFLISGGFLAFLLPKGIELRIIGDQMNAA